MQQEGQLCAQHCLNALLQGPFYTAVDLASLGQQLDDEERQQMAEGQGLDSDEYRRFIQQPSGNMDDTGFFSVQVGLCYCKLKSYDCKLFRHVEYLYMYWYNKIMYKFWNPEIVIVVGSEKNQNLDIIFILSTTIVFNVL